MNDKIKELKPKIEDVVNEYIEDENAKGIMLDFVAWLRKNKMSPTWSAKNYWKFSFKQHKVFLIRLEKNLVNIERFWLSWTDDVHQTFFKENNLQDIVCNNFTVCGRFEGKNCGGCPPSSDYKGIKLNICGNEIKNICRGEILKIVNPDFETIEGLKNILKFEMQLRTST